MSYNYRVPPGKYFKFENALQGDQVGDVDQPQASTGQSISKVYGLPPASYTKSRDDGNPHSSRKRAQSVSGLRGLKRVDFIREAGTVDIREAFMDKSKKSSAHVPTIRFDTLSQDRSTGDRSYLFYALGSKSSALDCPKPLKVSKAEKEADTVSPMNIKLSALSPLPQSTTTVRYAGPNLSTPPSLPQLSFIKSDSRHQEEESSNDLSYTSPPSEIFTTATRKRSRVDGQDIPQMASRRRKYQSTQEEHSATPIIRQGTPAHAMTQASPMVSMAMATPQTGRANMQRQMPNGMHPGLNPQQQQQLAQLQRRQMANQQAMQQMNNGQGPTGPQMAQLQAQHQAQLERAAAMQRQQAAQAAMGGTPQLQHMSPAPSNSAAQYNAQLRKQIIQQSL